MRVLFLLLLSVSCYAQKGLFRQDVLYQTFEITPVGDVIGGDYVYALEDNINPIPSISNVIITGTPKAGTTVTISGSINNNSSYEITGVTLKIYKATAISGTGETLSATINPTQIRRSRNSFWTTYKITETTYNILAEAQATLPEGTNPTSLIARSIYTPTIAP